MMRLTKLNDKTMLKTYFDYKLDKIDNAIYFDGVKTSADATTFSQLGYDGYYIDKDNIYKYNREKGLQVITYIDIETAKRFNGFVIDKNYLYRNGTRIIKSEKLEILASFPDYRLRCGLDPQPSSDYYLFRNEGGFWWVKVSDDITIRYFGKTLDTWLSPLFEKLVIPQK